MIIQFVPDVLDVAPSPVCSLMMARQLERRLWRQIRRTTLDAFREVYRFSVVHHWLDAATEVIHCDPNEARRWRRVAESIRRELCKLHDEGDDIFPGEKQIVKSVAAAFDEYADALRLLEGEEQREFEHWPWRSAA